MKKVILIFATLIVSVFNAQNNVNLVIFSEDGDPFYAFINGVKQNSKAETNVKVTGVSPNISLRIEFENKTLPILKQNMSLEPGFEHTAKIKRDMKQQLKLRYFGQTPLSNEPAPGVATVQYHSVENTAPAAPPQGNAQTITTSTVTTTHTRGTDNAAVNMNAGGVSIGMNITGMDGGASMNSTTSTTVTQTTTYSGSSSISESSSGVQETAVPVKTGCNAAMSPGSFSKMKQSIESKPFSDTKMSTAKVATKNACLSTDQVKDICKLFSMDEDKLTYAKYAYNYCVDKSNFYQVSEVFSFSSTADELNKFLEQ